jgi:nucleoid-associated protein Lsr2
MATKLTAVLKDDLDDGLAEETVRFAIGGTGYEIDLNAKNAAASRQQLSPCIEHARRADTRQRHRPGKTTASRERSGNIRRGRKTRASRSATTAASLWLLSKSTKPPGEDHDANLN